MLANYRFNRHIFATYEYIIITYLILNNIKIKMFTLSHRSNLPALFRYYHHIQKASSMIDLDIDLDLSILIFSVINLTDTIPLR